MFGHIRFRCVSARKAGAAEEKGEKRSRITQDPSTPPSSHIPIFAPHSPKKILKDSQQPSMWKRIEVKKKLDMAGEVAEVEMGQFQEAKAKIEHHGGKKLLTCQLCRLVCKM